MPRTKDPKKFKGCFICRSPYRAEIDELVRRRISKKDISLKYALLFEKRADNFYQTLLLHAKMKHPPILTADPEPIEKRKPVSFNEYADKLLQSGYKNVFNDPSQVRPAHVIAAQRTLLEERKLKNQEESMKLAFVRFMRGRAIEGEVIEPKQIEDVQPIREETLPTNSD